MKRSLVALSFAMALSAVAFQPPAKAPLPNFDRRTDGAAGAPSGFAPRDRQVVEDLKTRVPELEVTQSKLLRTPDFFSSRAGFLTGPDAEGLGVLPATARALPANDPHRPIKAFLNEHAALFGYDASALADARVTRDYVTAHNGLRTVVWQQQLNGIPVFEAITMGHVTRNGELVNLYTHFVRDANGGVTRGMKGLTADAAVNAPAVSAAGAIVIGAGNLGDEVTVNSLASQGPPQGVERKETFRGSRGVKGEQYAQLVWVPLSANALRLCWQVIVTSASRGEMFLLLIDAQTGEVIVRRGLTNHITNSTYNVFTSDSPSPFSPGYQVPGNPAQPPIIARTLVTIPALNTNASPDGWISDTGNETLGNNVDAHTDLEDDDQPDVPRPVGTPFHTFDFPMNLATDDPTNYSAAAVVSLFYWNNFMHDKLWELGFTEAAGNFQSNNFNRGGLGGDPVLADAQDGAAFKDIFHVDNANMSTPPDGFSPRMQMYVFSGPDPDRDGDLDAEVMCHEYTHGLSNRRVGGGIGIFQLQTRGMGEGWSDFYAMSLLSETTDSLDGNIPFGGYVTFDIGGQQFRDNYYYGIRRYPYATNLSKNPLTFKDIDPTQASSHAGIPRNPIFGPFTPANAPEVHNQGEVWCVTLWEIRANFITKYGAAIGNRAALQLVTDAMTLCPPNPNFLQSRDAILQADRVNNNNANYNELWLAFAKRGMGSSATCPDSSTTQGVVESFDLPGLSIVSTSINDSSVGNGNGAIDVNECVEVSIALRNNSVSTARLVTAVLSTTTPGVTVVQAVSAFPDLAPNAAGQNQVPFRISTSPGFVCGTPVRLTIIATSTTTSQQMATNTFFLRSGFVNLSPALFNNNTPLNIPDASPNGVNSTINVSGVSGGIGKLTVSLFLTHTFDADLTIELIGPDGTTVGMSKNEGGAGDNFGVSCTPFSARTTFDDNSQTALSGANPPFIGSFRPDEPLDVFVGKSGAAVNGAWRLHIVDDFGLDVGTLQCWTLSLFPTVCADGGGNCNGDLAVSATASPSPALAGLDLTYTVAVTNNRQISASSVTLTNVLPANVMFVSATSAQGACTFSGGTVRCNFGALASGSIAAATIVVRPSSIGTITSVFSVGGATPDSNPANNVATVVSSVVEPTASIVAAGAELAAESVPATGGIEAGETVTVNLSLRNVGAAATANLVAALQAANGVSAPSGPRNYGAIAAGAVSTQPFTFTAAGPAGSTIAAVLNLQDGIQNLGAVTFHFTIGGEVTVENASPITINQLGTASPYPATIDVSGLAGLISKVRVTLSKLSHSFPDDIDALLVGPRGQKIVLMSDSGGGNAIANRTLTFDSTATSPLPNESLIAAGTYLPTDYVSGTEPGGDVFPAPAPGGSPAASLAAFNLTDPNGPWLLFINDDGGNDSGLVAGGWSLSISTVTPLSSAANLAITASAAPNPAIVGEALTYTLTVANLGPSNATSVVVNDTIPPNSSFVGASVSSSFADGVATLDLGTLASGAIVPVTVTVTPNSSGSLVNSATVSAASADLDLGNNTVVTTVTANTPVADLGVTAVATPNPVFAFSNLTLNIVVTNRGPDTARNVTLLGGTLPGAQVDIGTLASGSGVSLTRTLFLSTPGLFAESLVVRSLLVIDPVASNDVAELAITVLPPAPLIVAAGAALRAETPPANGAIEPGELVTVDFGLRNVGSVDTVNLVATLLASGGVTSPGGPQQYGAMAANGSTVSRPFAFIATGAPGSTLTATLQLQDGAQSLGNVSFTFTLSASHSFTNGNVILIPDQGQATNYPATLTVSGVTGSVSKVTVTLNQLTHSYPEDVDMLLVGPAGGKVILMSDVGGGVSISDVTLTFDDSAAPLSSGVITSGTYHPTDRFVGDTFPAPAPAGPHGTNLSVFNGTNPNGTWSLYVVDDAAGDLGRINSWTLNIQTAAPVPSAADVGVTVTAPADAESGASFSYAITVVNDGPATATGVVLNDALPAGFTLGSVTVSQGSYSTGAGSVTANLGAVAPGASATITISGAGVGPRTMTNAIFVTAAQTDLNLGNNSAAPITRVAAPLLTIRGAGTDVVITWAAPAPGYILETSANATGPWSVSSAAVTIVNGANSVTVPATSTAFFRLRKP